MPFPTSYSKTIAQWVPTGVYTVNIKAVYINSVYRALGTVPQGTLPTNGTYWVATTDPVIQFPIPARPIPQSLKTNNLIFSVDSGFEQRRKKSPPRMTFDLTWPLLEKAAYEALQSFFLSVGGSLESFSWKHPVSQTTYVCRFDMDQLVAEYHTTTNQYIHYFKCSAKLLQTV